MLKIGRFRIGYSKRFFYQTQLPVVVRRFWFFRILKEVDLPRLDKKARFAPGTTLRHEGRIYRYLKPK